MIPNVRCVDRRGARAGQRAAPVAQQEGQELRQETAQGATVLQVSHLLLHFLSIIHLDKSHIPNHFNS